MKYKIVGDNLPAVICSLEAGEALMSQAGAMSWMSEGIQMETVGGGVGKVFGRMFSGESLFLNRYQASQRGEIAFASHFPGNIRAVEISPGKSVVIQKRAFLASTEGVELSVFFQKKLGAGFFGGEGFIMQKLSGSGIAFVEIDGAAVEYELQAGEKLVLDTGYLCMMDETVSMDIVTIKGVKNIFLGGEGLFNTVVTGPGKVVVQTLPANAMASNLMRFFPSK